MLKTLKCLQQHLLQTMAEECNIHMCGYCISMLTFVFVTDNSTFHNRRQRNVVSTYVDITMQCSLLFFVFFLCFVFFVIFAIQTCGIISNHLLGKSLANAQFSACCIPWILLNSSTCFKKHLKWRYVPPTAPDQPTWLLHLFIPIPYTPKVCLSSWSSYLFS